MTEDRTVRRLSSVLSAGLRWSGEDVDIWADLCQYVLANPLTGVITRSGVHPHCAQRPSQGRSEDSGGGKSEKEAITGEMEEVVVRWW